jgi:hypothetical protein
VDPALEGVPDDRVVSPRPLPAARARVGVGGKPRARYERDLLDNGGLTAEEARAKAKRDGDRHSGLDTAWLFVGADGEAAVPGTLNSPRGV